MTKYGFFFNAMTTQCEVQCYGLSVKQVQLLKTEVKQQVLSLVDKYNFHSSHSWLNCEINNRRKNSVAIDEELFNILSLVRHHAEIAGDSFDITVGTCVKYFKRCHSVGEIAAAKSSALQWMGKERWRLEDKHVVFDNPHTRFDLGGVIKEFAVDKCLMLAKKMGATAALVNFGGDVNCFGRKPNGERFVAAVQDPENTESMLFGLDLEGQALTTSGHYARKSTMEDGDVSHLISLTDTSTKSEEEIQNQEKSQRIDKSLNARLQWLSATVVSGSALVSGIYSTSLMLNPQATLAPNLFAITVAPDKKLHTFNGAARQQLQTA